MGAKRSTELQTECFPGSRSPTCSWKSIVGRTSPATFSFKDQRTGKDRALLLTAILADAINLGLVKMAEACPSKSLAKPTWLVAWHIRDETYRTALAELVNFQHRIPFAVHWGEGTTSSSDGQRYRAGGRGEAGAEINARYGTDTSVTFYTHISDQYAPFHSK